MSREEEGASGLKLTEVQRKFVLDGRKGLVIWNDVLARRIKSRVGPGQTTALGFIVARCLLSKTPTDVIVVMPRSMRDKKGIERTAMSIVTLLIKGDGRLEVLNPREIRTAIWNSETKTRHMNCVMFMNPGASFRGSLRADATFYLLADLTAESNLGGSVIVEWIREQIDIATFTRIVTTESYGLKLAGEMSRVYAESYGLNLGEEMSRVYTTR